MKMSNTVKSGELLPVYREWLKNVAGVDNYSRPPHVYKVEIHDIDTITYDAICVHTELSPTSTNDITLTYGRYHKLIRWSFLDLLAFTVAWSAVKVYMTEKEDDIMRHVVLIDETAGISIHVPSFNTMIEGGHIV